MHQPFRQIGHRFDGDHYFLKWNPASPPDMFRSRGRRPSGPGQDPGALRIPEVLGTGGSGTANGPWLAPHGVHPPGAGRPGLRASPGRRLGCPPLGGGQARTRTGSSQVFGWHRDNFIGSLPQENDPRTDWGDLLARSEAGAPTPDGPGPGALHREAGAGSWTTLLDRTGGDPAGCRRPGPRSSPWRSLEWELLPGSLGEPVLIDPAVYRGVGEVDLAMMELFGSFPRGFVEGYAKGRGLDSGV